MPKGKKKSAKKPATKTVYRTTPAAKTPVKRRKIGGNGGRRSDNNLSTLIAVGSAALVGFVKGKGIGFPQIPAIGINGTVALVSGVASLFMKPGKGKDIASTLALIHGSIYAADMGNRLATGKNLLSGEEEISGMPGMNALSQGIPAGMTLLPTSTVQQLQAAMMEGDEDDMEGEEDDMEGEEDLEGDEDDMEGEEDLEGDEVSGFSIS